jgi:hypothetical protein
MRYCKLLLPLLLGPLTGLAQQEPVYKWTDAEGRTHYGNQPPPGVTAEPAQIGTHATPVPADSQVYTWKDAQGNVHYGSQPPTTGQSQAVDMSASPLSTFGGSAVRPGEEELLRQRGR